MWKLRVLLTALSFVFYCAAATQVVVAQEHGSTAGEVEHESEVDDHAGESDGGDEHGEGTHGTSAHGGGHGNTNPLSVDPDLALFTLVIFALLLAILGKFAWGPIRDALDRREKNISDQLADAQRNNEEARRLLNEHEAKLATTADEIKELMERARRDADAQKQTILAEAETAATAQKDRALREIDAAKNFALEDLARTSVDQAVGLAGRIVGQRLNKDDHAQLIKDAVQQFPSDN